MTLRAPLTWAALAAPIALALAACGSSGDDPAISSTSTTSTSSTSSSSSSSSPSASSSSSSSASGRTIAITVKGSTVTPAPTTVDLAVGEQLTLTVTSDHADQLHIHGFEVEKDLVAGTPTTVTLTGAQPGVYEVETHHPELRLMKIAVR
jgi:plastocyanin